MQRAQAIFVILALLATPLALVARTANGDASECSRMCCLPHGGHSSAMHHAAQKPQQNEMSCHHGETSRMLECTMKAGNHQIDYVLIAPIVPTAPSAVARIATPEANREISASFTAVSATGFLSAPFQPPRA